MSNFLEYLSVRSDDLLELTIEHAILVLSAVAIAAVIGVGLGVATYRSQRLATPALATTGIFLTIPSLALFAILIAPLGIGFRPALVALVLYGLLPIVRNTIVGLRQVDPAAVESALGMGMERWRVTLRIELPQAWPIILTGLRVSTQILVGIAAIAAIVNAPGLGKDIFRGLARIGSPSAIPTVLGAVLGIVVLAILLDIAFLGIGRFTTPRGIRN